MSNGPLPSKLTLLSSLPSYDIGDKVRFLGWLVGLPAQTLDFDCGMPANSGHSVTSYSIASAQLALQHHFPKTSEVTAVVDVRLLLEKIDAEQTAIGQWVNIIGYVAVSPTDPANKKLHSKMDASTVHVQALVLWPAGPLRIDRYEICLADMRESSGTKAEQKKLDII